MVVNDQPIVSYFIQHERRLTADSIRFPAKDGAEFPLIRCPRYVRMHKDIRVASDQLHALKRRALLLIASYVILPA